MVTPRYEWRVHFNGILAKCQPTVINQQVQPDRNGYFLGGEMETSFILRQGPFGGVSFCMAQKLRGMAH